MRHVFCILISAITLAAQTPTDTAFYAVAYVDVMPASKAAAMAAFKQYRDASAKEDGFVRFELFEQVGRPGHVAVTETWANQKAYDEKARQLARLFNSNFKQFADGVSEKVRAAGPIAGQTQGNGQANSPGLAGVTTAIGEDQDIELFGRLGREKRLPHDAARGLIHEIAFERTPINLDLTLARAEEHARHG